MSSTNNVGIILPDKIYKNMTNLTPDVRCMLNLFEKAAKDNNIRLCYLTLNRIRPDKKTVEAFIMAGNEFVFKEVVRPNVIYSRIIDYSPICQAHIKSLLESGITVFNRPNYDVEKYTIHQLIEKSNLLKKHLPFTLPLTLQSLKIMMNKYNSLILKPNYGEKGMGAMKLDRSGKYWRLSYKLSGELDVRYEYFINSFPRILLARIKDRKYIIQETIPLATYRESPFDMRVSVQKNGEGNFTITGIMCKVAKHNDFLTNGAQGSSTYQIKNIFPETNITTSPSKLRKSIFSVTLGIAHYLDQHFPHLADLGFDIGVTKEGVPYFIECNFISDYLGGIVANGELITEEWSSVFTTPIDYAKYLLDKMD